MMMDLYVNLLVLIKHVAFQNDELDHITKIIKMLCYTL